MHEFFARRAARELAQLPGVEHIFVYGSVANGTHRVDSDIDLAIIVDDCYRSFPLTLEGQPQEHHTYIDTLQTTWKQRHDVKLHIVTYWSSEFKAGITFPKREGRPSTLLEGARELYREMLVED
jgi:predicted nucleotidyltransferase